MLGSVLRLIWLQTRHNATMFFNTLTGFLEYLGYFEYLEERFSQ